jgi:hypothetical protein
LYPSSTSHDTILLPCTRLFDDLVRLDQEAQWDRQTERLRGLHVDDALQPYGLLDWEIGGLGALEDFVDVDGPALCQRVQIGAEDISPPSSTA